MTNELKIVDVGKIKFVWRGTYSASTLYEHDDLVIYDDGITNSAYISMGDQNLNNTPSTSGNANVDFWQLAAQGGSISPFGSFKGEVQFKSNSSFGSTSTFLYDESNVRIGVGTSVPTQALEVQGTVSSTDINTPSRISASYTTDYFVKSNSDNFRILETEKFTNTNAFQKVQVRSSTVNESENQTLSLSDGNVFIFTSNSTGTWTTNITSDEGVNNLMKDEETINVMIISSQNNSSYYTNSLQVDGSGQSVKWIVSPTSGSSSGRDLYRFSITKTGNSSFLVFAQQVDLV